MQQTASQGWYVASWGTWGWIETGLKLVAIAAGFLAFFRSSPSENPLVVSGNPELGAVILVGLMTLLTIVALGLRFRQQEVISMIYAILNFLGHTALLIALLRPPLIWSLPPIMFAVFMALGEFAKQRFLSTSGYTENGQSPSGMLNFSRAIAAIYTLLAIFILI